MTEHQPDRSEGLSERAPCTNVGLISAGASTEESLSAGGACISTTSFAVVVAVSAAEVSSAGDGAWIGIDHFEFLKVLYLIIFKVIHFEGTRTHINIPL